MGRFQDLIRSAEQRPGPWLCGLGLAALLIRGTALACTIGTPAAGDEPELYMRATRLAMGGGFARDAGRAPGLLVFYAGAFALLGPAPWVAKLANVLVSSATIWPVHFIGRQLGGVRVGLLAAAGVALYPSYIAFSHYLWAAPLYVLLVACGLALVVRSVDRPAYWRYVLAGVVLAASALVKEAGLLSPLVAAGWVAWHERADAMRAAAHSLLVVGAFVLTLLPWTIHINEPELPFAWVTRTGYMNLFIGNHPRSHGHAMQEYPTLGATRLEAEAAARERALAQIRARLPLWPLEKAIQEIPRFFTPTSFAVRRLLAEPDDPGGWGYRFRFEWANGRSARVAAVVIVVASYVVVVLAGTAGLVLARRGDLAALLGLFVASQILPSVVTFAMSRFRLASMLCFVLGAASLAVWGRRDFAAASTPRRATAIGMAALVLFMIGMDMGAVLESTGR